MQLDAKKGASQSALPGRPWHSLKGKAIPENMQQCIGDPSPFRNKASAGLAVRQEEACVYLAGNQTHKCKIIYYLLEPIISWCNWQKLQIQSF